MRRGNLRNPLYRAVNPGFGKFVIKATFAKNLGGRVKRYEILKPDSWKSKKPKNVLDLRISIIS